MRAALLTNILTPYRVPVYRALAREGLRWRIFTNADSEFDRSWSVDAAGLDVERVAGVSWRRHFAFGGDQARQRVTVHLPLGLWRSLRRFSPDVVVSAELGPRTLLAWLYCRAFGVPFVIWSYHSRQSATCSPALRVLRRLLVGSADALVGMGSEAREVLCELGARETDVFDAPNSHDVEAMRAGLDGADPDALRARLRIGSQLRPNLLLCVGRLVAAKGIGPLLGAWYRLPAALRERWTLLFVGDGPMAEDLRRAAGSRPRGEIVTHETVPASEMACYYAAADLVVFPSLGDPWGLVVNEAMACGVPVLCSDRAGCARDLIQPGENGWSVDPTHTGELAEALHKALEHPGRESLGVRAERTIAPYTPQRLAAGLLAAVDHAKRSPGSSGRSGDAYSS